MDPKLAEFLKVMQPRSKTKFWANDDESGAALVRAIVAMGESLGLATVAEGVENEDQRDFLAAEGYTYGQGFLFAKPLAEAEAQALLERLDRDGPLWVPTEAPVLPDLPIFILFICKNHIYQKKIKRRYRKAIKNSSN